MGNLAIVRTSQELSALRLPSSSSIELVRQVHNVPQDWYQHSLKVPADKIDPLFVELAKNPELAPYQPTGHLILGCGADVIQLMLGVAKGMNGRVPEINILTPRTPDVPVYLHLNQISIPEFENRQAGTAELSVNNESIAGLELMVKNYNLGAPLRDGYPSLVVPLKHAAIGVVSSDGSAELYFRTKADMEDFQNKIIRLPDEDRLPEIDSLEIEECREILSYSLIVMARALPLGWTMSQVSRDYLSKLASHLGPDEMELVSQKVKFHLKGAESSNQDFNQALREVA